MAKLYVNKLAKKYGLKPGEIKGKTYADLMRMVTAHESENVSKAVARLSQSNYKLQINKFKSLKEVLVIPDIEAVLPKRSVYLRKAAQSGNVISETLKTKLTGKIRDILKEKKYIVQTGENKGRINEAAVRKLRREMKGVYNWYTKKTGEKMPSNLDAIATTELRSTINETKREYNQRFAAENKEKGTMKKRWRQNKALSMEPRPGHSHVNGKVIKVDELFSVPLMIKRKGRWIRKGWTKMRHPHDSIAPAEQNINCHCDCDYIFVPKKIKLEELKEKKPLETVRPKLVELSIKLETIAKSVIERRSKPAGSINMHADGSKWQKQADGSWIKIKEAEKLPLTEIQKNNT